jgi:hypothetical protein
MTDTPRSANTEAPGAGLTGPALFDQLILDGAQLVLGGDHLGRICLADPIGAGRITYSAVLERQYGLQGGRGLALKTGRIMFQNILAKYGEAAGFYSLELRLLPQPRRMARALQLLGALFANVFHLPVTLAEAPGQWAWQMPACPSLTAPENGINGEVSSCGCYLMVGLLQEFMAWAGGSRFYRVMEVDCCCRGGSACLFQIDQSPLD